MARVNRAVVVSPEIYEFLCTDETTPGRVFLDWERPLRTRLGALETITLERPGELLRVIQGFTFRSGVPLSSWAEDFHALVGTQQLASAGGVLTGTFLDGSEYDTGVRYRVIDHLMMSRENALQGRFFQGFVSPATSPGLYASAELLGDTLEGTRLVRAIAGMSFLEEHQGPRGHHLPPQMVSILGLTVGIDSGYQEALVFQTQGVRYPVNVIDIKWFRGGSQEDRIRHLSEVALEGIL